MENLLLTTIKDALLEKGISEEIAILSLRAFCRKYGGQKIYFSTSSETKRSSEIFNLISEALDNYAIAETKKDIPSDMAEKITRVFLKCFYNISEYVPLEITAFRKEIALDINKEYLEAKDKPAKQIEICQRYNISFVTFLKLRKIANSIKTNSLF